MTTTCTQCGECCKEWVCPVGMLILENQNAPCSALEYKNEKYWCGLALNPETYNSAIASMSNSEIIGVKNWIRFCIGINLGTNGCKAHATILNSIS